MRPGRCAIHHCPTPCGTCDQLAYDQAQAYLEAQHDAAEARAEHDADRAEAWMLEHRQ